MRKRKKVNHKKKFGIKIFMMVLIISIVLILTIRSNIFNIKYIEVYGNSMFSTEEIISDSGIVLQTNIFKIKLDNIKNRLESNPYFKDINISRKYPNKIVIKLAEREEVASIAFMDYYIIIDEEGKVLRTSDKDEGLSVIYGLEFENFSMGDYLTIIEPESLNVALEILNAMKKNNIFFPKIDVSNNKKIVINIFDELQCNITNENIEYNVAVLKNIIYDLYNKGIYRGLISIGSKGYFTYNPID